MFYFMNFIAKIGIKLSTKVVLAILLSNLAMIAQIGAFALIFFGLDKNVQNFYNFIEVN